MGKGIDNLRYREMKTEEGVFVPDIDIEYPEDRSDEHIAEVRYDGTEVILDETYPYYDTSLKYRVNHALNRTLLRLFVIPVNRVRYGLKIVGKKNLRAYRKQLKGGAMTVCNHVYRWDLACVLDAIGNRNIWFPIYGEHLRGKDAWFMRYLGGVPIPESRSGMRPFDEAFDRFREKKEWLHMFPEAASWRFYTPIRSFKKGAFSMAWKYNIPVLPFVLTYRRRTGIYNLFDKPDVPLLTLRVGTPIFPDTAKPRKEECERLLREAHAQMVSMAGIISNPWPAEM